MRGVRAEVMQVILKATMRDAPTRFPSKSNIAQAPSAMNWLFRYSSEKANKGKNVCILRFVLVAHLDVLRSRHGKVKMFVRRSVEGRRQAWSMRPLY
jgi:hypothetical protein